MLEQRVVKDWQREPSSHSCGCLIFVRSVVARVTVEGKHAPHAERPRRVVYAAAFRHLMRLTPRDRKVGQSDVRQRYSPHNLTSFVLGKL